MAFQLVFAAFVLVGLTLVWWGVNMARRDRMRVAAAGGWAEGQATILASGYEEKIVQGSESDSSYYLPRVRYRFAAAGGEHEGTRPFLIREQWTFEGPAKAWLAAHGEGATVPVWFDPADPSQSALVLDKPRSFMPAFVMAIGVCVAVFGAYMAVAVV